MSIYRMSIRSGDVPEDGRQVNVTPIFKKGTKTDPSNYRPVSLLSICCIVRDRIVEHMMDKRLIEESQHGFVRGRQCFGSALTLCGSGSSFEKEYGSMRIRILDIR
jgi:hypothetical protein